MVIVIPPGVCSMMLKLSVRIPVVAVIATSIDSSLPGLAILFLVFPTGAGVFSSRGDAAGGVFFPALSASAIS